MAEGQAEPQENITVNTQSVSLQPLQEFNPDADVGESLGTRWNIWIQDFEMFILASGITDEKRKRALLLYQAGKRVREIFRQIPDTGDATDYEAAKTKLHEYFQPQENRRYAVYRFRQAKQEPNETLDQFHTRLRTLAQTCSFHNADFEIEQQIITAGSSSRIRKKALRDPTYDLKSILIDGRRAEMSTFQARDIESKDTNTDRVNKVSSKTTSKTCHNCGGTYPHEGQCPAKGKECRKCQKLNHFARVCRGKMQRQTKAFQHEMKPKQKYKRPLNPLNEVQSETDSSDNEYLYTVSNDKTHKVNVKVCGRSLKATVDTGAMINVIDRGTYEKIPGIELKKTNIKAFAYTASKPVKFIGKFEEAIETRRRVAVATFYVAETTDSGNLISATTAEELGLVSFHLNKVTETKDRELQNILNKHSKVFHGLGKLKQDKIKLNVDKTTTPRAQPQRRIPYHIRQKVQNAIEQLEKDDIIERVPENQPTPWVSPIVAVPKKNGDVRICVDMRAANKAIKRVRHPIPTVEDISFELNGATCFSKLDLTQAYHQLELHEDSRYITTFSTHIGLFRYKRLNYGTNAAVEIFQYTLQTQLQGLVGVKNIADDILVYGKTQKEHNTNLNKCLKRISDKGLRLNQAKCSFLNDKWNFSDKYFPKTAANLTPNV
ncbi:uncharacterized protein K02A2.6-like [Dendronephthya gigantea]|uniref:uncharacterized protein K02A2.6-like n=1 Tax=Dendronephthya gigantea TaxID=151771 RepID=UPI00106A8FD6|nr:uncharacterized protein K02A2.6-like [Dendronephthya gigantea]